MRVDQLFGCCPLPRPISVLRRIHIPMVSSRPHQHKRRLLQARYVPDDSDRHTRPIDDGATFEALPHPEKPHINLVGHSTLCNLRWK